MDRDGSFPIIKKLQSFQLCRAIVGLSSLSFFSPWLLLFFLWISTPSPMCKSAIIFTIRITKKKTKIHTTIIVSLFGH